MKALVCEGLGKVKLKEVPNPTLKNPTDALIRITYTSFCASDLHIVYGDMAHQPEFILGHEYVGMIEEVGTAVSRFRPGDRILGPASPCCHICDNCRKGLTQLCQNTGIHGSGKKFGDLGGTHSEYMIVPFADVNLVHIPSSVTDEQALFVGDILSTGYFGVNKPSLRPGENVVVLGAGPVGLCSVHTSRLFGPRKVIAVDVLSYRLDMAQKMGATDVLNVKEGYIVQRVLDLTEQRGPNVVVDASGLPVTLQQAAAMVAKGGRICLLGLLDKAVEMPIPTLFYKCATLYMGLGYLGDMQVLLELIEAHKLDLTPLITHCTTLSQIEDAFYLFKERMDNMIKIAIKID